MTDETLQQWALELASTLPGSGGWDEPERRDEFMARIAEINGSAVSLSDRGWDRVARHAAHDGGEILADASVGLVRRTEFLQSLATLALRIGREGPSKTGGLQTYWDTLVESLPDSGEDSSSLRSAAFAHLTDQLRQKNKELQRSALYGLNRLRDPRTADVVGSLRGELVDDEVRELADKAVRGDAW